MCPEMIINKIESCWFSSDLSYVIKIRFQNASKKVPHGKIYILRLAHSMFAKIAWEVHEVKTETLSLTIVKFTYNLDKKREFNNLVYKTLVSKNAKMQLCISYT